MDPVFIFVFIGVIIVFVIMGIQYLQSDKFRAKRLLSRATAMSVKRAQQSPGQLVKLRGQLRFAEETPLFAPLSRQPCAYFKTVIEQQQSSGNSRHWKTIIEEQGRHQLCWIDDGSGEVSIVLSQASVVIHLDKHYKSGFLNDTTAHLEAFLSRHGKSSQGWVFNKTLRYSEGVLEEGELIVVCGKSKLRVDPAGRQGNYRAPPQVLEIVAPDEKLNVVVSDDPDFLPSSALSRRTRR